MLNSLGMNKTFTWILFWGNLVLIIAVWFSNNGLIGFSSWGRLSGLLAFYLILWQLLLISRVSWIERAWGHDKVSRLHHLGGMVAICVLVAHPFLLSIGYGRILILDGGDLLLAVLGYFGIIAISLISLYTIRKRLRYEVWYFIHVAMYVAIIIVFEHQSELGGDMRGWFGTYWQALFYLTLTQVIYSRFVRPIITSWQQGFRVEKIKRESNDVISLYISGNNLARLGVKAGQFVILRFLARGLWWEAHPYSISKLPEGGVMRVTVKALGDFSTKLRGLRVGTHIFIEGPLGKFTSERAGEKDTLLIAGGIGITPVRAIFEELANNGKRADLFYFARAPEDFVLKDELEGISNSSAHVHYEVTKDSRSSIETVKNSLGDFKNRFVYICGPVPMMEYFKRELLAIGMSKQNILYEKFSLG